MTETPKTKTTAKERAQEGVAVLQRRANKLHEKARALEIERDDVAVALSDVKAQLDYAKANPLLGNTIKPSEPPVDQEGTR